MTQVFDDTVCMLGEGPLWHPTRNQLFWFDIVGKKLLTRAGGATTIWSFDDYVSAAGWVDDRTLLIASARELFSFDVESAARSHVAPLETENPVTRSNDGRADPFGGFWIGTMGIKSEAQAGSIYRYYRGEVRKLYGNITVSNAICFAPDASFALYCDTREKVVRKVHLDPKDGWPAGDSEIFIDMRGENWGSDGAVIDADGNFWNAQWGARRVAQYDPAGNFLQAIDFGAKQTSCPAFGGPDLSTLYVTSARTGLDDAEMAAHPENGMTFSADTQATGQREHRVIL